MLVRRHLAKKKSRGAYLFAYLSYSVKISPVALIIQTYASDQLPFLCSCALGLLLRTVAFSSRMFGSGTKATGALL